LSRILNIRFCVFVFVFIAWCGASLPQINIYERKPAYDLRNNETAFESPTRFKIDLSGQWQASFGKSDFINITVPFSSDYNGSLRLRRSFDVPDSLFRNHTFLFVSEGINYYSEVRINNVIVSRNSGGMKLVSTEIQENVLARNNEISVQVVNTPDNEITLPLACQNNYSRNYTGVSANVYILAVPKIYINDFLPDFFFEGGSLVRLTSTAHVNTNQIDSMSGSQKTFYVRTELIRKSTLEKIAESAPVKFDAGNYQTYTLTNEITVRNFEYWSPEKPELYLVRTVVYEQDAVIDELASETGFINAVVSGPDLLVNGKKYKLNGINYFQDLPRYADALEYSAVERDLQKIKEFGFNCIRIPGKPAHPFVVAACGRIGLFLLQEIPFNEVPARLLKSERYIKDAADYAENLVKRDKHSPSVLFWGIGNDFDVSAPESEKFASRIKETISSLDKREIYYTTRDLKNDRLDRIISLKGLNLVQDDLESIKETVSSLERNKFVFVSAYGVSINNKNRNGSGDRQSVEFQAKLLTESYKLFSGLPGSFVNSFADYNSECPLLTHYDESNYYLITNGLFDYAREPKYTAGIFKKLLYNQGYQKIPEGTEISEKRESFFFLISAIAALFIFIAAVGRVSYLKENMLKSMMTPKNFMHLVKEQSPISGFQNTIVLLFVSFSVSLYASVVVYYLRLNSDFDLLLSKIAGNGGLKILMIDIINSPVYLLVFFSAAFILFVLIICCASSFFSAFARRKVKSRTVFTVIIWSFIPMIIFFVFGMLFSKALEFGMLLNLSFYLFVLLLIYCLYKIINRIRYVYEYSFFKSYVYGTLLIAAGGGLLYFYFVVYKSMLDFWYLIKTFN